MNVLEMSVGLTGILLGGFLGAWWAVSMIARKTRRAIRNEIIDLVRTDSNDKFSKGDVQKFVGVATKKDESFKDDVVSSDLLWALSAVAVAVIALYTGKDDRGARVAVFFLATYPVSLILGAWIGKGKRRKDFVASYLGAAQTASLPPEKVKAIEDRLRENFNTSGTLRPDDALRFARQVIKEHSDEKLEQALAKTVALTRKLRTAERASSKWEKMAVSRNEAVLSCCGTLGAVIGLIQKFSLDAYPELTPNGPKEVYEDFGKLLDQLVRSLGGAKRVRAAIYIFDVHRSHDKGFPVVRCEGADRAPHFAYAPMSRKDEPIARFDTHDFGPHRGPAPAGESKSSDGWRESFYYAVPFMVGSGQTHDLPWYAALRVDVQDDEWGDLNDPNHVGAIILCTWAALADFVRAKNQVSASQLFDAAKRNALGTRP